jgi:hypothetical protein
LAATSDATFSGLSPDYIYTSTDGGATWTQQTEAGIRNWGGSASSADGSKLLEGDNSSPLGYVYTATLSPTLTTSAAASLSATGATLNGSIDDVGNGSSTVRGFVYGTGTSYGATITESGTFLTGSFIAVISSLTCNTAYHFDAYATNGYLGYGNDQTFTTSACSTPPPAPAVVSSGGGWSGGCSTYPQGGMPSWGVVPCTPTNPSQGQAVSPVGIQPSPAATSSPPNVQSQGSTARLGGITLSKNYQLWDTGEDILALQKFFNTHGFIIATTGPGSPENETLIFGTHTYQALIKFQTANNLPATGYLGPLTRAALGSSTSQ